MVEKSTPEIFFHVGLGKTATTYLQYRFFPKLKGICYIQRTRYRTSPAIIKRGKCNSYLVSREFDNQLEREVTFFASHFPDAKAIIVLRRHDSWIASQYRRFVKNGFTGSFDEFFDAEGAVFKREDLLFYRKIKVLEAHFSRPPMVLFYEDLREDPYAFFDKIAETVGATYRRSDIDLDKKHSSYNRKQLKAIQRVSRTIDIEKRDLDNWLLHKLRLLYISAIRYSVLYLAPLLPAAAFDDSPLIPPEKLSQIREQYTDDWQKCQAFARQIAGTD
ncbi:MAG: hypothetical protein R3350_04255 [Saprospiraceae bacterium]|nr:hypothetical protein [Saprospiraceae bacterium]